MSGVNNLFKLQKKVCIRYHADFVKCEMETKVGIAIQTLNQTPLNALRHLPERDTNGWYIWAGKTVSDDIDFFQPLHFEHLNEYVPELLQFLGLAPGWRVLLAKDFEDVWYDGNLING